MGYHFTIEFYYPKHHGIFQEDTIYINTAIHSDDPEFHGAVTRHIKNMLRHDPDYTGGDIVLTNVKHSTII